VKLSNAGCAQHLDGWPAQKPGSIVHSFILDFSTSAIKKNLLYHIPECFIKALIDVISIIPRMNTLRRGCVKTGRNVK
jgi:hypothetical protein